MATTRTVGGPTPGGGARAVLAFSDDAGNPADEADATRVEVTEYDAAGRVLLRTYARLGEGGAAAQGG